MRQCWPWRSNLTTTTTITTERRKKHVKTPKWPKINLWFSSLIVSESELDSADIRPSCAAPFYRFARIFSHNFTLNVSLFGHISCPINRHNLRTDYIYNFFFFVKQSVCDIVSPVHTILGVLMNLTCTLFFFLKLITKKLPSFFENVFFFGFRFNVSNVHFFQLENFNSKISSKSGKISSQMNKWQPHDISVSPSKLKSLQFSI